MEKYETPQTTGELNDAIWAAANGMRAVHDLTNRAQSLVSAVDRAERRGEIDAEAAEGVIYYADQLRELVGPEKSDE